MDTYEELLIAAENAGIDVIDYEFNTSRIKGLYCDGTIALNHDLSTSIEKSCVLAEELGHYYTSTGEIIDLKNTNNVKQEHKARLWGYDNRVGLYGIISCYRAGCRNLYEMAEYLNVTEEFLHDALSCYRQKYGTCKQIDNYVIYFEPSLGVLEMI